MYSELPLVIWQEFPKLNFRWIRWESLIKKTFINKLMGSKTSFVLMIKSKSEAYNQFLDVEGLLQDGCKSKPKLTNYPSLSHKNGSI